MRFLYCGTIARPASWSGGEIPTAAQWNAQFDTLYTEINGLLDSNNIAANAISSTQLASGSVSKIKLGTMEYVVSFSYPDTLYVTSNSLRQIMFPYAGTLTKVMAKSGTTPSPQNLVIDVNNNGTTVLNASAMTMTGTGVVSADGANVINTSIAANAILSLDILSYGTATGGASPLTVNLFIDV